MSIYNNFINWTQKKSDQIKAIFAEPNPSQHAVSGLAKTFQNLVATLKKSGTFLQSLFYTVTGLGKIPLHTGYAAQATYTALATEEDKESNLAWQEVSQEANKLKEAEHQILDQGALALSSGFETLSHLGLTGLSALETAIHTGHAAMNGLTIAGQTLEKLGQQLSRAAGFLPAFNMATATNHAMSKAPALELSNLGKSKNSRA